MTSIEEKIKIKFFGKFNFDLIRLVRLKKSALFAKYVFFYCFSPQYEIMLQKLRLITSDEAALLKLMVTPDSSLITLGCESNQIILQVVAAW